MSSNVILLIPFKSFETLILETDLREYLFKNEVYIIKLLEQSCQGSLPTEKYLGPRRCHTS